MNKGKYFLVITPLLTLSLACNLITLPSVMGEEGVPPATPLPVEAPPDEEPAPVSDAPAPADADVAIPAADSPAIMDCSLFDLAQFNTIVGAEFILIIQDQLGSCNYDAGGNYRLLIGGGQPTTSEDAQAIFETTFGIVPGAAWQVYEEGFQLGLAASSITVTGQGVSASGHATMIVAAGMPSSDLDALQGTLIKLVVEATDQLNRQW